ncbi:MAG: hypothetical protein GY757_12655 [bacterium]|nr:hypothetical protein [bacterium]
MKVDIDKGRALVRDGKKGKQKNNDGYEDKKVPLVSFDTHIRPFLMFEAICNEPLCECNEIRLKFVEVEESGEPLPKPITFSFFMDLDTWKELRKPEKPPAIQSLVEAFIANLTVELKVRFRKLRTDKKENSQDALLFKMTAEAIEAGELVSYAAAFGKSGSSSNSGVGIGIKFVSKDKTYMIDDQYCINPECNCNTVHLVFFDFKIKTAEAWQIFTVKLSFETGVKILDNANGFTKKRARNIYRDWKQATPGAIETLKKRYDKIKKLGNKLSPPDSNSSFSF